MAAGSISPRLAFLEWFALSGIGQGIAASINSTFFAVAVTFQVMALAYNVRPLRLKDIPYLDVLSEAINSPLRLLLGWSIVLPSEPPSLMSIMAFWMAGGFEMARKRLKEYRFLQDRVVASAYRKSFAHYDENCLKWSLAFYASLTVIFALIEASNFSAIL